MFGLTFDKLLIIGVIAVFVLGPDRLPHYAAQLGQLVRKVRGFATQARERVKDEMGEEFDEVDWRKLDPRQYDPRRIIRDALLEDDEPAPRVKPPTAVAASVSTASVGTASVGTASAGTAAAGTAAAGSKQDSYYTAMKRSAVAGQLSTVAPPPIDSEAT
ncbi:twin-arginine translocase TatA/TatE family subunit [Rathayibacter oskolensis]|uniref:twin-arginine translocase TatA/TatE family subunit n=1 Tax=Rathayibacter oskolensis TaxID=1891671 RepID=UPI00101AE8F2